MRHSSSEQLGFKSNVLGQAPNYIRPNDRNESYRPSDTHNSYRISQYHTFKGVMILSSTGMNYSIQRMSLSLRSFWNVQDICTFYMFDHME